MNIERLRILIAYMRKLPAKAADHFDMSTWFTGNLKRMNKNGFIQDKKDVMACGTSACALGWAATVPLFQKQGLQVYAVRNDFELSGKKTGGLDNTVRGKAFFDLTDNQFSELFGINENLSTPEEWADHAEDFIHNYEPE